eukprot:scaffold764_cov408-Prasinococcus_capsulatus_cf.AAC.15
MSRTAFRLLHVAEVSDGANVKVGTISHGGSRVFLGTEDGNVLKYRLKDVQATQSLARRGQAPPVAGELDSKRSIGRRSVEHIAVLDNGKLLAILCGGAVTILDSETLAGTLLSDAKKATCIAVDNRFSDTGASSRLLVVSKKLLQLYEISGSGHKEYAKCAEDVILPEAPLQIGLYGETAVYATKNKYMLVNLKSAAVAPLFALPSDASFPALLKMLPKRAQVILRIDVCACMVVNMRGEPVGSTLVLEVEPSALGWSSPYLLATMTTTMQSFVGVFEQKSARLVQKLSVPDSDGSALSLAESSDGTCALITSGTQIWCMKPIPADEQLRQLLRADEYSAALHLAALETERCSALARQHPSDPAIIEQFVETQELYDGVQIECGCRRLRELDFGEAMEHFVSANGIDSTQVLLIFPELARPFVGQIIPLRTLWQINTPLEDVMVYIRQAGKSEEESQTILKAAKQSVSAYLLHRRKENPYASTKLAQARDSILACLLAETRQTKELELLFADRESKCSLDVVESVLQRENCWHALAMLLQRKGHTERALQIWQRMGSGEVVEPVSGGGKVERAGSSRAVGVEYTIMAIKKITDEQVFLEHIMWLLHVAPSEALDLLVTEQCKVTLSPQAILPVLRAKYPQVLWKYLRHLVSQSEGSTDVRYHTELALALIRVAAEFDEEGNEETEEIRAVLQQVLQESTLYNEKAVSEQLRGTKLYHEQVILYRRLEEHEQALRLLVNLREFAAAEHYCEELGQNDVFLFLMSIYLEPGEGRAPMYNRAISLLNCHGADFDPQEVLEVRISSVRVTHNYLP